MDRINSKAQVLFNLLKDAKVIKVDEKVEKDLRETLKRECVRQA